MNTIEELLSTPSSPESFRIRFLDSDVVEEIKDVKAVFYGNSLDVDPDHKQLNFHNRAPVVHGISMRFQIPQLRNRGANRVNSIRSLVDREFFLLSTYTDNNNRSFTH